MPDGHVAEEGDVECGGDVEDVVRDHHLGACEEIDNKGCLQICPSWVA